MLTFRSLKELDATEGTVKLLDGIDTFPKPFSNRLSVA